MSRIYVASSWRNEHQPLVVQRLRGAGHEVYDFRNPAKGNTGFHWSDIDPGWQAWSPEEFREALQHPVAQDGLWHDAAGLEWADACVLVMPCGRSAHLEAGWCIGSGRPTAILVADGEPELMYGMAAALCTSLNEVLRWALNLTVYQRSNTEQRQQYRRLKAAIFDHLKSNGMELDENNIDGLSESLEIQARLNRGPRAVT